MQEYDESDYFLKFKNEKFFKLEDENFHDKKAMIECFEHFDKNRNTYIELDEFKELLKLLFSYKGASYYISEEKITNMFDFFKSIINGQINIENFERFWLDIVKPTLLPKSALLIVDVQNDFIDGSLAIKNCPSKHDGAEVVPVINQMIESIHFDVIAYTLDWHPKNHCSFIENIHLRKLSEDSPVTHNFKILDTVIFEEYPDVKQKLWPSHCVANTKGADLNPNLIRVDHEQDTMKRKVIQLKKGTNPDVDSYSAFFDNGKISKTTLDTDLKYYGITDIYLTGLTGDICVAYTGQDALSLKYRVIVVEDACRGTDLDDIALQKKKLMEEGAVFVTANQVNDMVNARNRKPELAYFTFLKMSYLSS